MSARILVGDVREMLATLPDQSVQTVITSPPYFGLRDYQVAGQIGLEPTPAEYVATLVAVFREVRRVLRDDGTVWLNLGDSYAAQRGGTHQPAETLAGGRSGYTEDGGRVNRSRFDGYNPSRNAGAIGLKHKDLIGIPWRVAFGLQDDGWYLRSDIIWSKPNPMPESVTDRPTKAHEYLFLLAKQPRYYYDATAIAEPLAESSVERLSQPMLELQAGSARANGGAKTNGPMKAVVKKQDALGKPTYTGFNDQRSLNPTTTRNKRTVWQIATQPMKDAHFATYPEALVEPCVLAGTSERGQCPSCGAPWRRVVEREGVQLQAHWSGTGRGNGVVSGGGHDGRTGKWRSESQTRGWEPSCTCDAGEPVPQTVLDPFCGSGTTGVVALRHGRSFVGIDLNPAYARLAEKRIRGDAPLFNRVEVA